MVLKQTITNYYRFLAGFCAATVGLGLFAATSASALTYQSVTDVSFTFNSAISISVSDNDLVISDLTPGSASDSNVITVGVSTNAGYGYSLIATAGTATTNTDLTNTLNSTYKFTSLATNDDLASLSTDNTWGFAYSSNAGNTWSNYSGLPLDNDDNGETGKELIATTNAADNKQIDFKIAARSSTTQAAGEYTNVINFYAIANPEPELEPVACASGYICYNANSLGPTEGTMGRQFVTSSATTAKLFASNFSRTGYGFAGWSDAHDYATNANANFYGPNEDITFTAGQYSGSNPGLSLYAVWVKSAGNFQDSTKTAAVCNNLTAASVNGPRTLASVSALTDTRDNQTYAIAKLADNNCWMIENLRLDNTAELTTLNTNNPLNDNDPTNPTVTLKHNYTDTQTHNTLSATNNQAYNADTAPDGWCTTNSAACYDQSRLRTDNTANRVTYTSGQTMSTIDNLYSYGNYYNWYSATAGRGTYGFDTNNNSTAGDLCPTNWRLPKGGDKTRIESNDDNEFWNLVVDSLNGGTNPANYASQSRPYYTGATEAGPVDALIRTWPNNFIHSGLVNGASLSNRGSYGYYWSSTAYASIFAYYLYFYSTYVGPGSYIDYKYYGRSIRCLASPSP